MNIKFPTFAFLLFAPALWAGTLSGKVSWEGSAPKMRKIKMNADPACLAQHSGDLFSESLVLGDNNGMANVVVRVVSGLPDKKWVPPSNPAVLDQRGCLYQPHVLAVMTGQMVKILNSDGILHNVNARAKVNKAFNLAMPRNKRQIVKTFSHPENIVLKCNVHPWMKAFLIVQDHPFFQVTGADGLFRIENLPPGNYLIEAWHEKAGTRSTKVTVSAGSMLVPLQFTFSKPSK